jgi:hypothetical protein
MAAAVEQDAVLLASSSDRRAKRISTGYLGCPQSSDTLSPK